MSFSSLGLIDPLLRALEALEYRQPTPVQSQAIPAILAGRDLMAAAQTGTGKTAGFALPLLQRLTMQGPQVSANSVRALVLVPTRELAVQVHDSFIAYGQNLPLRMAIAFGGVSINPQMMKLRRGADVLVATPGRLLDLHRQNAVGFSQLETLVLDEADRMLDLGFARELDAVFAALPVIRPSGIRFGGRVQREAEEREASDALERRRRVRARGHPPTERLAAGEHWQVTEPRARRVPHHADRGLGDRG